MKFVHTWHRATRHVDVIVLTSRHYASFFAFHFRGNNNNNNGNVPPQTATSSFFVKNLWKNTTPSATMSLFRTAVAFLALSSAGAFTPPQVPIPSSKGLQAALKEQAPKRQAGTAFVAAAFLVGSLAFTTMPTFAESNVNEPEVVMIAQQESKAAVDDSALKMTSSILKQEPITLIASEGSKEATHDDIPSRVVNQEPSTLIASEETQAVPVLQAATESIQDAVGSEKLVAADAEIVDSSDAPAPTEAAPEPAATLVSEEDTKEEAISHSEVEAVTLVAEENKAEETHSPTVADSDSQVLVSSLSDGEEKVES
jgi:hypothetical protein